MADGIDDFVGGVLLVWAFAHLVAATLEPADWARLRTARRVILLRGALTLGAALQLTSSEFGRWFVDGSWVLGAFCLLIVPAVAGCVAERWFSGSREHDART